MDWQQALDRLDFYDELLHHDEVHPVATSERDSLVTDGQGSLSPKAQTDLPKLIRQALLVCGFEQPRPELPMYLDAGADHEPRAIPKFFRPSTFLCHSRISATSTAQLRSC